MMRCLAFFLFTSAISQLPDLAHAQTFSVNGHKLYLQCEGQTPSPVVVLIAGGRGTTETWDKVQPQISQFVKVCSYDRAGLGKSDAATHPQSAMEIVDDLEFLLKAAYLQSPYVLVGHSIGGIYARLFDERHDDQVAAMVLLDSSHEEQIWRFAQREPKALTEYPYWQDRAAVHAHGFLLPGERLRWRFSKPLIVIEHAIPPEPVWHEMQEDLASRSPEGHLITAKRSSHYIQKREPEIVIEQVRSIVAELRRK